MSQSLPFTFILFGATGDLAGKKILPALFKLYRDQHINSDFVLIGNSRTPRSDDSFRELVHQHIHENPDFDEAIWSHFAQRIFFVSGNAAERTTMDNLFARIHELVEAGLPCENRMFHVATLPELYPEILKHLGEKFKTEKECGWSRVLIEKPFGTDLESSRSLNKLTQEYFKEDQLFRIDHFLGKETVQNILAFRFANGLFKPIWNHKFIDSIQITALENLGVEGREIFYDSTGVIRDVVQNHILQIMALIMMETPDSLSSDDIRKTRQQLLKDLHCYESEAIKDNIIYGQYGIGDINGQEVRAYTQEKSIPNHSKTETFVALKAKVDNKRWQDVPVYIRAGKRMGEQVTEVSIQFTDPKKILPEFKDQMSPNILTIRIQPNEGIVLRLDAKNPGYGYQIEPVNMQFCYDSSFEQDSLVEAYERLIADAIAGNHVLFPNAEEVEAEWRFINPLLQKNTNIDPIIYPAGGMGPTEINGMIEKDGRFWIEPSPLVCAIPVKNK